ncbi:hypothetical protein W911_08680 [Hyphomicrobium nitrativorans NL23]|uniref:DUF2865 domain-containing protein n=1 Tax=Hyphomicrobium nitrativorans NL23 TaxID=1029756 RepID=V5SC39_9HYPH|nr:DUF2865 domain-containing protein [Hyphomicrobium nitrativorans]AHB48451.1 hypothetical protein W911_08680 [Hyphomicrobium nitrativorans NL23]
MDTSVSKAGKNAVLGFVVAAALATGFAVPALAQGWWPWSGGGEQQERPPPTPREPVYNDPYTDPYNEPPPPSHGAQPGRSPICLDLERRLVQEGQRGSANVVPQLEAELRDVERSYRTQRQQLERSDCYEYFLFSKTLRRTRKCIDLSNQVEAGRRRMDEIESRLHQLQASSGRSYQDEIVRELARNNCGATYQQQARRQDSGSFGFWEDQESSGTAGRSGFGSLPYATYRTVCVRLCDGYYFPVSFSTLPNHFQRDEDVCQSRCASPAALYYHQNPGAGMEQAVAASTNEAYSQLKTAFRYRKEYVKGCSCKVAEYQPPEGTLPPHGAAAGAAGGWATEGAPAGVDPGQPAFGGGQEELPWSTTTQ